MSKGLRPNRAKKTPRIPYRVRWGHERKRTLKGHPKRAARRQRAAARMLAKAA